MTKKLPKLKLVVSSSLYLCLMHPLGEAFIVVSPFFTIRHNRCQIFATDFSAIFNDLAQGDVRSK